MVNKVHTTIRIRLVLLAFLLVDVVASFAQVSFQSVALEGSLIGPRTLFHATLFNAGGPCEVSLEGEVRTQQGEMVLSFQAEPFHQGSGIRTVSAGELVMRSFIYGPSEAGRAAQRFQRLPGGQYHYCLRLHAPQAESDDEYCDAISVDESIFLDLVQPWDGDSIDEVRPPLTWTISGSGPSVQSADVRITLSPMPGREKASQALASERPLFMVPHVKQRTLPYPVGIADLERGKCYAWQAERLDGTRVIDRSEPWSFCVRDRKPLDPDRYVLLGRMSDAVYDPVDEQVHFRFDEQYSATKVGYSILNEQGMTVPPVGDVTGSITPRSPGAQLFDLDLQPYQLKTGYYTLVVTDAKGRSHQLKFHIQY